MTRIKKEVLSERFSWALQVVEPLPNDQLLEVGCGTGVLAGQVAHRLKAGHLLAVDKSKPMVEKAIKRNQEMIEKGKIELVVSDFFKAKPRSESFDKVYAFNVSPLWKQAEKALPLVAEWLKPSGRLYLFYQPPYEITKLLAEEAKAALESNHFKVENTLIEKLPGVSAFCLIAAPLSQG